MQNTPQNRRILAAVAPGLVTDPPPRWQQQKSARTRARIIEGAVTCLVEHGYAGLTTAAVAEQSQISRGTMHHHFASRFDLVTACTEHVFHDRMRSFLIEYTRLVAERGESSLTEVASEAHWHSVQSRAYAAYVELATAARTDPQLRMVFEPAAQRYDRVWTEEMIEAFPQWQRHGEALKLANDLTIAAHTGLLMQGPVFGEARVEAVRTLIAGLVKALYEVS